MAQSDTDVILLSWTVHEGSVAGVVYWTYLDYPWGHEPRNASGTVWGTMANGALTLNLSTERGSETWQASIAGDLMTATFAGTSGLIGVLMFAPATVDAYNVAVTALRKREARLWQEEFERQQEQLAEARRNATSCSIRVSGHDATLVVEGAAGVVDKCLELADRSGVAPWTDVTHPANTTGRSVVCSGTLQGYDVTVLDTGSALWGSDICDALRPIPHVAEASDGLRRAVSALARDVADLSEASGAVHAAVDGVQQVPVGDA